jgi:hypothetical protein
MDNLQLIGLICFIFIAGFVLGIGIGNEIKQKEGKNDQ